MAEPGLFGLRRVSKRLVPPRTKVLPEVCPFLTIQTPDVGGLSSWSTKTCMTLMSSPRSSAQAFGIRGCQIGVTEARGSVSSPPIKPKDTLNKRSS
jgi:hypothetical protein